MLTCQTCCGEKENQVASNAPTPVRYGVAGIDQDMRESVRSAVNLPHESLSVDGLRLDLSQVACSPSSLMQTTQRADSNVSLAFGASTSSSNSPVPAPLLRRARSSLGAKLMELMTWRSWVCIKFVITWSLLLLRANALKER